jgi:hypothetical protein
MGVKFWLQNLHAQFTERSVPAIFSSMVSTSLPLTSTQLSDITISEEDVVQHLRDVQCWQMLL